MSDIDEKLSTIFHDIKGPLVSISGYLQLLKEDLKEVSADIDYIDILLSSSKEMENAIEIARKEVEKLVK